MSDVLHNSAMRDLKHCEQFFKYRHVDEIEEGQSTPLDVGTWFHLLMEAQGLRQGAKQDTLLHDVPEHLYFGLPDDENPKVNVADVFDADGFIEVRQVHEWVIEEVHSFMPEGDDEIEAMPDNLWFLYERYTARHGADMVREDVLGVEVQWQREDTHGIEGVPEPDLSYGGQGDRVVRKDGLIVVRDHKTTGKVPSSSFLLTDSQLHLYAWGMTPWLKEHGLEVDAVEYDFAYTYWPTVRLTKAGNLYSNQKVIDLHAAKVLLAEALEERGEYDGGLLPEQFNEFLDKCATEGDRTFFRRHLQPINVTTVKTLLDEGASLAARKHSIEQGGLAIRNTGKHCDWCPMQEICVGDLLGNDTTLLREEMGA